MSEKNAEIIEDKTKEQDEKPDHPPCPTCKEEWEGDGIFCDLCGYQESDEDNPLHPLPVADGGVADAAGVLADAEIDELKRIIGDLKSGVPMYFVTFNTPDDQTPGGIAYTLYNDWAVGVENPELGALVFYDPSRRRVEIAIGKTLGGRADMKSLVQTAEDFAAAISEGNITEGFEKAITKVFESSRVSLMQTEE
jgi:uncharacterized membrane protein YgcG